MNNVMSVKDWIVTMLLMCIPLVNIILLFVWAFGSDENETRKNWAKANLIMMIIAFVLSFALSSFITAVLLGTYM